MKLPELKAAFAGRKALRALGVALAAGLLVAEAVPRAGLLERAETVYYDLWHRVAGKRFDTKHVVLAVIDEPTLAAHQDTPLVFWTPLFARAVERLQEAGARVVGFDFLFTSSAESWIGALPLSDPSAAERYGLPFRQAIATGRVVLAASRLGSVDGADEFLLPAPEYLLAVPGLDIAGHVALVDLPSDEDGGARRFQVAPALKLPPGVQASEAPQLSFPGLLAARAGARRKEGGDAQRLITYAGPPGTVPRVSLRELLAEGPLAPATADLIRGKVVIVGANFPGMNDVHVTPYASALFGSRGAFMAGAEVQANAVETILAERATLPVSDGARLGWFVALIVAVALAYRYLSPWAGLLALAGGCAGAAALGYAYFGALRVFPTAALQAGLAGAYLASYGLRLTREERERARIGSMFSRYVSPQVVAELVASPTLPELGGKSERVTVLFSDIRGFTTFSEKLAAGEVVEMLNAYLARACEAVLAEGGTIDKFIGDAIMAEFGAPLPQRDHARRALRVALALQRTAEGFRPWMEKRFAGRGLHEFRVGVGVHTGDAVIGNIGSRARMEFTAIGDTVNTASRLESATKTLGCAIVASEETVRAAGEGVRTGKSDLIHVKGKEQGIRIFEIVGLDD